MSGIAGSRVREPNIFFRLFAIIFLGSLGLGIVLSWKASIIMAAEYQEMPVSKQTREIRKKNQIYQEKITARKKR
ncbi:MAG: hypothetical protein HYZ51_04330 [Candidatus Doudnabacteria bacterium]|nr:hypothetical protein [Candidatus Doudnabacteria bacterium]